MNELDIARNLPIVSASLLIAPAAIVMSANCSDSEILYAWNVLLNHYPDDAELRDLYLLYAAVCTAIECGTMHLVDAADRFERARTMLVGKWIKNSLMA